MQITASADVAAPKRFTWIRMVRPEPYETRIRAKGLPLDRSPESGEIAAGTRWTTRLAFLGAARDLVVEVTGFDAPDRLTLSARMMALKIEARFGVAHVAKGAARIEGELEFRPIGLAGRASLVTVAMARHALEEEFGAQIAALAGRIAQQRARAVEAQGRRGSAG